MQMAHGLDSSESRKLGFVYRKSGIRQRFSALKDFNQEDPGKFAFFPKQPLLWSPFLVRPVACRFLEKEAPVLANLAIQRCLVKADVLPEKVSHLILVSCTGMYAPGVEMDIIQAMGFSNNIERYAIHFMGCYAAFNAIKFS